MGKPAIVDASFLVALWRKNDQLHSWAVQQARLHPPPWITCDSDFKNYRRLGRRVIPTRMP